MSAWPDLGHARVFASTLGVVEHAHREHLGVPVTTCRAVKGAGVRVQTGEGHRPLFRFEGAPSGPFSIEVGVSPRERVLAHWRGYIETPTWKVVRRPPLDAVHDAWSPDLHLNNLGCYHDAGPRGETAWLIRAVTCSTAHVRWVFVRDTGVVDQIGAGPVGQDVVRASTPAWVRRALGLPVGKARQAARMEATLLGRTLVERLPDEVRARDRDLPSPNHVQQVHRARGRAVQRARERARAWP